jgi:hypothetical protein
MYLGPAACGLAIVNDRHYLQFQQITAHCLKLLHPRPISFNDMPSGGILMATSRLSLVSVALYTSPFRSCRLPR